MMHESNLAGGDQFIPGAFWLNDSGSPRFSNVDQLLSPGFSISENAFQPFFTNYDSSGIVGGYGHMSHASDNVRVDLLKIFDTACRRLIDFN